MPVRSGSSGGPLRRCRRPADLGSAAQDTPLYPDFTAAELVTMGGKLDRCRWDAPVARNRLAQFGIPPNQRVGTLSGGQRAQVALAKRPGC